MHRAIAFAFSPSPRYAGKRVGVSGDCRAPNRTGGFPAHRSQFLTSPGPDRYLQYEVKKRPRAYAVM
jgi:hypothetical protein